MMGDRKDWLWASALYYFSTQGLVFDTCPHRVTKVQLFQKYLSAKIYKLIELHVLNMLLVTIDFLSAGSFGQ